MLIFKELCYNCFKWLVRLLLLKFCFRFDFFFVTGIMNLDWAAVLLGFWFSIGLVFNLLIVSIMIDQLFRETWKRHEIFEFSFEWIEYEKKQRWLFMKDSAGAERYSVIKEQLMEGKSTRSILSLFFLFLSLFLWLDQQKHIEHRTVIKRSIKKTPISTRHLYGWTSAIQAIYPHQRM